MYLFGYVILVGACEIFGCSMWDLDSLARDRTWPPCTRGALSLSHWAIRKPTPVLLREVCTMSMCLITEATHKIWFS